MRSSGSTGDKKLSPSARETIQDADVLCFSSISIWEIARKVKKGELEMPVTPGKETLKNKCFNTVAMPPCDLVYCAA